MTYQARLGVVLLPSLFFTMLVKCVNCTNKTPCEKTTNQSITTNKRRVATSTSSLASEAASRSTKSEKL